MPLPTADWDALDALKYQPEAEAIAALRAAQPLSEVERAVVVERATQLVKAARASKKTQGVVEGFLQQFSLGTREGLALMCLAESLLRIPDAETRDRLIAEKIGSADWADHLGQSDSLFVNASTWGLMLTGKLVDVEPAARANIGGWLKALTARLGAPVIRQAVGAAVGVMGEQFVLGRTIEAALARAKREDQLCSFDMLGEGARTEADAARYERLYANAIEAVGRARAQGQGPEDGHGVSIKLSALSPRYEAVQEARVWTELYPRLKRLALLAAQHNLNLTFDAEEADRLVLSLKLLDALAHEAELGNWTGLGVVVQAYQKRGRAVIEALDDLAQRSGRRLMVRLVKGAYWDNEIKRAQVAGRPDYPVFTTKPATDLSYLVCANALIAAAPRLYPQFATHNAHTLAAVSLMAARAKVTIEMQRLHGMGDALYDAAQAHETLRLRAYAPVGGHEDLLPYLVRRLLENGANTSFVHALLNDALPVADVVADPIAAINDYPDRNPKIPTPDLLYGSERQNPFGLDFTIQATRATMASEVATVDQSTPTSAPIIAGKARIDGTSRPIYLPYDAKRIIGHVVESTARDLDDAANRARAVQPDWDKRGGVERGRTLRAMGAALEANTLRLVALLAREAGKALNDGVAEVREAIDFCRYYAHLAETQFGAADTLQGPTGEVNQLSLHGRGVFACISPWNFPLAIFTGQIAAALAAGNAVLAKPAEQTPLIAAEAVRLFHQAGLNPDLLALLPGDGATVGTSLVTHPLVNGVAFTGGTDTAHAINLALAQRPGAIIPFIAETGGLNAMFCDTSALKEQVIDDVLQSAFGAAGQRCSALRILYLPRETADRMIADLVGALRCLRVGNPSDPATDIGPVIDDAAKAALQTHVARLEREAKIIARYDLGNGGTSGHFFGPVIAEIPTPDFLEREVFGPILHIYRYGPDELEAVATALANRGYGLTLGIHSRIDRFAEEVRALVPAGNTYINRSMVGAVVGVQPFGGEGLSGTGPKAGGPHALLRYTTERAVSINIAAQGGDPALLNL